MARLRGSSKTGKALGAIGLSTALAVAVMVGGVHALTSDRTDRASASVASSRLPPGARATPPPSVLAPTEPERTLAPEGLFPGDADQQSFFLWAATHRVGSLNLPGMDPGGPALTDVATGYCQLLSEAPTGSGRAVTEAIRQRTGASEAEAREFLERSVAAFCPQKTRHLV